jgi:hypothetical protein
MSNAISLYNGRDSHGYSVQIAQRVDGVWFYRAEKTFKQYRAMSKWKQVDWQIVHPDCVKNQIEYAGSPEYIEIPADDRFRRITWGFNTLRLHEGTVTVRLPKIEIEA